MNDCLVFFLILQNFFVIIIIFIDKTTKHIIINSHDHKGGRGKL